jgi:hypothetical protein
MSDESDLIGRTCPARRDSDSSFSIIPLLPSLFSIAHAQLPSSRYNFQIGGFLVKREIFAWISVTCSRSKLIPKRGDAERDKGEQTLAERYTIGRWATHSLVNLSWWF